jgi:hypothetical protein
MTTKAIQIAAVQTRLAGRLTGNGAQGRSQLRVQPVAMFVQTLPPGVKIAALPEEMKIVAEFEAFYVEKVLLRIGERLIHALALFVPHQRRSEHSG